MTHLQTGLACLGIGQRISRVANLAMVLSIARALIFHLTILTASAICLDSAESIPTCAPNDGGGGDGDGDGGCGGDGGGHGGGCGENGGGGGGGGVPPSFK